MARHINQIFRPRTRSEHAVRRYLQIFLGRSETLEEEIGSGRYSFISNEKLKALVAVDKLQLIIYFDKLFLISLQLENVLKHCLQPP